MTAGSPLRRAVAKDWPRHHRVGAGARNNTEAWVDAADGRRSHADESHMFPRLRSFLTTWIQRDSFEDSLDEEIRFHLNAQTEDFVRTGVPTADAERRARTLFGNIEAVKNDCWRAHGLCRSRPKSDTSRASNPDRGGS